MAGIALMNTTTLKRGPVHPLAERSAQLRAALLRHLPFAAQSEPRLRAALRQSVEYPGKLIRARLVLAAATHHGLRVAPAMRLACAVEYFHTASLLLDDLPCMDDAVLRRGEPCVHRRHGEATAILAALALINRAYALIGDALSSQPARIRRAANAALDRALGLHGLVGGQAWDLAFAATDRAPALVGRIAAAKTGALFTLAVELPALLARPSSGERRALRRLCVYWGQWFQLIDDIRDELSGSAEAGKTTGRDRQLVRPNLVVALGLPRAQARRERLAVLARRALAELNRVGVGRWDYLNAVQAELARSPASAVHSEEHHAA